MASDRQKMPKGLHQGGLLHLNAVEKGGKERDHDNGKAEPVAERKSKTEIQDKEPAVGWVPDQTKEACSDKPVILLNGHARAEESSKGKNGCPADSQPSDKKQQAQAKQPCLRHPDGGGGDGPDGGSCRDAGADDTPEDGPGPSVAGQCAGAVSTDEHNESDF